MNDPQILRQAKRDYLQSRILTAHPVEIVEMLYQVAVDSLQEAIAELKSGDRFARSRAVSRAQEAVHELAVSLDRSVKAPFTANLAALYQYVLHQINMGHSRQSEPEFQDALTILTNLAGTWSEVKEKVCQTGNSVEESGSEPEAELAGFASPYASARFAQVSSRDWSC